MTDSKPEIIGQKVVDVEEVDPMNDTQNESTRWGVCLIGQIIKDDEENNDE